MDAIYMESMNCKVLIQNTAGSLIKQRVCGERGSCEFRGCSEEGCHLVWRPRTDHYG